MGCSLRSVKIATLILLAIVAVVDIVYLVVTAKSYIANLHESKEKDLFDTQFNLFLVLISLIVWLLLTLLAILFTWRDHKLPLCIITGLACLMFIFDFVLGYHFLVILAVSFPFIFVLVYACMLPRVSN